MEENSNDDLAKEHYIFVGNFKREYKRTTYITENQFYKDLDICRHFGNDKVFFYDLKGFLYHYGWEGVEQLGQYNQNEKVSYVEYKNYKSITFLTFYCGLILIDMFASLENDLVK